MDLLKISKEQIKMFIYFCIAGVVLSVLIGPVKLLYINQNIKGKKKYYVYNKNFNLADPISVIKDKQYFQQYREYCFYQNKKILTGINYPVLLIGAGDSVYIVNESDSTLVEVFYADKKKYNNIGIGNLYIWKGFLNDSSIPRNLMPDINVNLQQGNYPSF